jgi:hypothetical protein
MISYTDRAVILGRRELEDALRNLPGRVVQKIMDIWTLTNARKVADAARRSAPRDRRKKRRKPETARLWRSIRASKVKNVKRFPNTISRAIAYGAGRNQSIARMTARALARAAKGNARRTGRATKFGPIAPRGRHLHWVTLGTKERVQRKTGRRTGAHRKTSNFFAKAAAGVLATAGGEVGTSLREAYDKGIQAEINRLSRKYR